MDPAFENEIAWVTGGGSGIGEAAAKLLAELGATVLCTDINSEGVQRVAAQINQSGGTAHAMVLDVSKEEDNAAAVGFCVESLGGLHMAFLNAGYCPVGSVLDYSQESFDKTIQVNLYGALYGLKHAGNAMKDAGTRGRILITGTLDSIRGSDQSAAYIASKHGALGLMKSAAVDFNPLGIRVNAVMPGLVGSPGLKRNLEEGGIPMPAAVDKPEQLAKTICFLLSNDSSLMTGQIVKLDHGFSNFTHVPGLFDFYQGNGFA